LEEAEYVQHPLEIACAQLCGLGHYRMIGYIVVETPETYDRWMKQAIKDKLRSGESKWAIWDKNFPQYNNAE
jgi:heme/copper-type cytochrome/quinol oxidase subunit 2